MESKKKYLVGILAFAVVALVASGGLYAYFNDTESSNGNLITAGTLDLQLDGVSDVTTAKFTVLTAYPGYTTNSTSSSVVLSNAGNVAGKLTMSATITATSANLPDTEPEIDDAGNSAAGDLQEVLYVRIYDSTNSVVVYEGLLSGFTTSWNPNLAASGSVTLNMYVWVPTAATNQIQGDSVTFDLLFTLNQA
jgi:spore coat-associated protein N